MYVIPTVFFAPTLQPDQQSPQYRQAYCITPATFGPGRMGDRHRRQLQRTARRFCRLAHTGKLGKALRTRHRRDTEHCLRQGEPLQQQSIADHRVRPTGLAQPVEIGPKHNAGVDQRPAAKAGRAEHGQPLADRQVV